MAHELGHIRNRYTLVMTLTAMLAVTISMLVSFALFLGGNQNNPLMLIRTITLMFLAPLAAALVQMAISYTPKYAVDRTSAEFSGKPLWLASTLEKLELAASNPPTTKDLLIVNPLHKHTVDGLFSSNPPMSNGIRRLHEIAGPTPRQQSQWCPR